LTALHSRFEPFLGLPLRRDLTLVLPETDGKSGQVGCTQCSRFRNDRADNRHSEEVSLKLAEKIVARSTAINPQLMDFDSGIALHALDDITCLVSHRFE